MRNIIFMFLCFFLLFSCTKKNILNTENIEENKPSIVSVNEEFDKNIYNDDLETDYNNQKIIERRHYSNPLYEFWTLGGRYTTYSFYYDNRFREYCTFISNLDGFSDAMIIGNFFGVGNLTNNDTRADYGTILLLSENNGYYSFHQLTLNNFISSKDYFFDINDNGVIILTSGHSFMLNHFKDFFKIQYKYQEDKLVLFNYTEYEYVKEYPYLKEYNLEMIEFIYLKNKIILRNYKKNENIKDKKHDIVYINEDTEDLKKLYIEVLRKDFLYFIDTLSGCWYDSKELQYYIPAVSRLNFLTKKEVSIFENCVYEYFNGKSEDELELINKNIIFDLLEEMKTRYSYMDNRTENEVELPKTYEYLGSADRHITFYLVNDLKNVSKELGTAFINSTDKYVII